MTKRIASIIDKSPRGDSHYTSLLDGCCQYSRLRFNICSLRWRHIASPKTISWMDSIGASSPPLSLTFKALVFPPLNCSEKRHKNVMLSLTALTSVYTTTTSRTPFPPMHSLEQQETSQAQYCVNKFTTHVKAHHGTLAIQSLLTSLYTVLTSHLPPLTVYLRWNYLRCRVIHRRLLYVWQLRCVSTQTNKTANTIASKGKWNIQYEWSFMETNTKHRWFLSVFFVGYRHSLQPPLPSTAPPPPKKRNKKKRGMGVGGGGEGCKKS